MDALDLDYLSEDNKREGDSSLELTKQILL